VPFYNFSNSQKVSNIPSIRKGLHSERVTFTLSLFQRFLMERILNIFCECFFPILFDNDKMVSGKFPSNKNIHFQNMYIVTLRTSIQVIKKKTNHSRRCK
jgi:hypothetical protein